MTRRIFILSAALVVALFAGSALLSRRSTPRTSSEPARRADDDPSATHNYQALVRRVARLERERRSTSSNASPAARSPEVSVARTEPPARLDDDEAASASRRQVAALESLMKGQSADDHRERLLATAVKTVVDKLSGVELARTTCTTDVCRLELQFEDGLARGRVLRRLLGLAELDHGGHAHFEPMADDGSAKMIAYVMNQGVRLPRPLEPRASR